MEQPPVVSKFQFKHILQLIFVIIVIFIFANIIYGIYYLWEGNKVETVMTQYKKTTVQELRDFSYNDCLEQYNDKYLCDFYIASSAMSFLVGNQRFDYANLDMLKNVLIMGARYLELEVLDESFSLNSKPIVTTGYKDGQWQTSLNNIDFAEACDIIANFAFTPEIKPHQSPLFLYLKLKINNNPLTLRKIAKILKNKFPSKKEKDLPAGNRILPEINPAQTKICSLFNQVIIWSSPVILQGYDTNDQSMIQEFLNIVNKYPPTRINHTKLGDYTKPITTPNPSTTTTGTSTTLISNNNEPKNFQQRIEKQDPLTEGNKTNLTIVYPHEEMDTQTLNYDPDDAWSYGCQFVAINYQLNDDYKSVYLEKFKIDSIVLKPNILQKLPDKNIQKSIDDLLPNSMNPTDITKKQLPTLYENKPVYFRPYNNTSKVLTIENDSLVVKDKKDADLDIQDTFLIKSNLNNPESLLTISLESTRYANKYLSFADDDFNIQDWRVRKYQEDVNEFVLNASFIPMKPLNQTRNNVVEDSSNMISLYTQGKNKKLMIYHTPSDSILNKEDDNQNTDIANQSSFYMYKLPVKTMFNIRQTDGLYVHQEKSLLIKKKNDLELNGMFEFINETDLTNSGLQPRDAKKKYIHIKDNQGNYWNIDDTTLRSNQSKPSAQTRFYLEKQLTGGLTKIFFAGINSNVNTGDSSTDFPLICQSDGILRLSYYNEIDNPKTLFILGTSFKKLF